MAAIALAVVAMNLWLTVDSDLDGVTMPYVDVWVDRPRKTTAGRCVAYTSADGQLTHHVVSLPRQIAELEFGTVPDNPRQVIRVGRGHRPAESVADYLARLTTL